MKIDIDPREERIVVRVPKEKGQDAMQAAYLLSDRALAYVEEAAEYYEATLIPKGAAEKESLEALAAEFDCILGNQALRRKLAEDNRAIMEYLVPRALSSSWDEAGAPEPSSNALSRQEIEEIDRLIAETEAEMSARAKTPRDPLGIARTWEESRGK